MGVGLLWVNSTYDKSDIEEADVVSLGLAEWKAPAPPSALLREREKGGQGRNLGAALPSWS